MALQIMAVRPDPALLDLPWSVPLEQWPAEHLAALPRGISRHVVRFVRLSGEVIAIKEINQALAQHEYGMLRALVRLGIPCVEPLGVVTGRVDAGGEELEPCLITRHLRFSLPYRALFSQSLRPDTAERAIDALAALLVRLHLTGFWWGDVSLSNTLFRRDAGAFAAWLVDAETGQLRERLSDGQREHDLEIARINIAGEMMDLQAGELLDEEYDVVVASDLIVQRYRSLWSQLTASESFEAGERWRVSARIERLNELGFDVDELEISTDVDGTRVQIQPKVVDAATTSAGCCASPGSTCRTTRPGGCSTTSTPTGRPPTSRTRTRRSSPTSGCSSASSRWCGRSRRTCGPSSSRRRCSTRCSSTAGTSPSSASTTSRSPRRSTATWRTCCRSSPTRRPCWVSTQRRCP